MYITYIDESGKPNFTDPEDEFVLAALIINESEWKKVDNKVKALKRKHFPSVNPESFEFHATEIMNHDGVFKNLEVNMRLRIMEDILTIISKIDCDIATVIIRKNMLTSPDFDINAFAMKLLFERLCYFHDTANKKNKKNGHPEYGIVMIDSVNPKYDNTIRSQIKTLFDRGSEYQTNRYLIEDPIFIDSKYRHMSQLVDCVAYCIRRRYRAKTTDPKDMEMYKKFFDIIECKFIRKESSTNGFGIKIFP